MCLRQFCKAFPETLKNKLYYEGVFFWKNGLLSFVVISFAEMEIQRFQCFSWHVVKGCRDMIGWNEFHGNIFSEEKILLIRHHFFRLLRFSVLSQHPGKFGNQNFCEMGDIIFLICLIWDGYHRVTWLCNILNLMYDPKQLYDQRKALQSVDLQYLEF